jgi:molybdopterin/thiamine biosynthesis adenylyltransferase
MDIVKYLHKPSEKERLVSLNQEEILRYSRHLIMPEVGVDGQEKLKNANILLIGCGGLGSPLSMYLSAAGVGHLGLVDFDVTDFTNLQRQVAFGTQDVGRHQTLLRKCDGHLQGIRHHH